MVWPVINPNIYLYGVILKTKISVLEDGRFLMELGPGHEASIDITEWVSYL